MVSQMIALAVALALAARIIECLCYKKERLEPAKHQLVAVMRNFSIIALVMYIYFLVFVVPKKTMRVSATELSTMAADIQMVGGGAHLKRVVDFTPNQNPIEWPSQEKLSKAICESVRIKPVPKIKDF